MTFMLHSFYLFLPLAWAMNHTVHTVLLCYVCHLPPVVFVVVALLVAAAALFPSYFLFSVSLLQTPLPPPSPLPSSFPSPSFADADFHFVSQFDFISLCQSLCIHLRAASLFLSALLLLFPLPSSFFIPSCFTLCN